MIHYHITSFQKAFCYRFDTMHLYFGFLDQQVWIFFFFVLFCFVFTHTIYLLLLLLISLGWHLRLGLRKAPGPRRSCPGIFSDKNVLFQKHMLQNYRGITRRLHTFNHKSPRVACTHLIDLKKIKLTLPSGQIVVLNLGPLYLMHFIMFLTTKTLDSNSIFPLFNPRRKLMVFCLQRVGIDV